MRFVSLLLFLLAYSVPVFAQEATVGFGSVSANPDDPVEVTSQTLNISETDGTAIFTGDVVVVQGEMRLSAPRVRVIYDEVSGDVSVMEARGGVTLISGEEAAEGRQADYDVESGIIVMTGDVLTTQGRNAIASDRMDVDLNNNTAVMKGRVKTVLFPQEDSEQTSGETSN